MMVTNSDSRVWETDSPRGGMVGVRTGGEVALLKRWAERMRRTDRDAHSKMGMVFSASWNMGDYFDEYLYTPVNV